MCGGVYKNIYVIAVIDKRLKWPRCDDASVNGAFNTLLIGLSHKLIERCAMRKMAV